MSNPRLQPLLRVYTTLEDDQQLLESNIPTEISRGLVDRDWKLIEVVKGLQDALTSENVEIRTRGIGLLSRIIEIIMSTQEELLDRQTVQVLIKFFTTKLDDRNSLIASCTALSCLTRSKNCGTGEGIEITKSLFDKVELKDHLQSTRYKVYQLFDHLMSNCRNSFLKLGKKGFVKPYCRFVEGEKDPRNLIISFRLVKIILLEFVDQDDDGVIEDLFDITFCYFPITFTPPKDDPYGITSSDLIDSLTSCLSASRHFGRLALPLFLDKLQAASEKPKRQTLQALTKCFPIYGAKISGEWSARFSEALTVEVFHSTDRLTKDLALICFNSLFKTLYPDSDNSVVKGIAVQVVKNSLDELMIEQIGDEKRDSKSAMRILISLAASSTKMLRYVFEQTLPPLLKLCQDFERSSSRPATLTHLSNLLNSLSPRHNRHDDDEDEDDDGLPSQLLPCKVDSSCLSILLIHKDTLLSLFTSSTRSPQTSHKLPALKGLMSLITLTTTTTTTTGVESSFLTIQEIEFIVSSFNDQLELEARASSSSDDDDEECYDLAISNLIFVSKVFPKIIQELTFPILFSQLPDPDDDPSSSSSFSNYIKPLSAIAALSLTRDLFETFSLRLLYRLELLVSLPITSQVTTLYVHHLLITYKSVIEAKIKSKQEDEGDLGKYLENGFVKKLLGMFILPTTTTTTNVDENEELVVVVGQDKRLLVDVGKIIGLIFTRVETDRQQIYFNLIDQTFQTGDLSCMFDDIAKQQQDETSSFNPLSVTTTTCGESQRNLITLYSSIIVSLRPTVRIEQAKLLNLLEQFVQLCFVATNELQLQACLNALASLINKRIDQEEHVIENWLKSSKMKQEFWDRNIVVVNNRDDDGDVDVDVRRRRKTGLRVYIWICKSLIVRSHPLGYEYLEKLLTTFNDSHELGREVAKQLGVLVQETDKVLSKENFAIVRLLYKQRFFSFLLPKLVQAHQEQQERRRQRPSSSSSLNGEQEEQEQEAIYLIAMSNLLTNVPKQLTLTELPKLLPLLITSLDSFDDNENDDLQDSFQSRSNVIDTLSILVKEIPETLEPHIESIVTKTLKFATMIDNDDKNKSLPGSIKLRISSLNFLSLLPLHIPYLTLHRQKSLVLKHLGKYCIDDPKRQVRRVAVECRSRWFSYY